MEFKPHPAVMGSLRGLASFFPTAGARSSALLLGETRISDCLMESSSFPQITLLAHPQAWWESFEERKSISCDRERMTTGWFLDRPQESWKERGRIFTENLAAWDDGLPSPSGSVERALNHWPLRAFLLGKVREQMGTTGPPVAQEMAD